MRLEGGHSYATPLPLTFDRGELRGSLIAQKTAKNRNQQVSVAELELRISSTKYDIFLYVHAMTGGAWRPAYLLNAVGGWA